MVGATGSLSAWGHRKERTSTWHGSLLFNRFAPFLRPYESRKERPVINSEDELKRRKREDEYTLVIGSLFLLSSSRCCVVESRFRSGVTAALAAFVLPSWSFVSIAIRHGFLAVLFSCPLSVQLLRLVCPSVCWPGFLFLFSVFFVYSSLPLV